MIRSRRHEHQQGCRRRNQPDQHPGQRYSWWNQFLRHAPKNINAGCTGECADTDQGAMKILDASNNCIEKIDAAGRDGIAGKCECKPTHQIERNAGMVGQPDRLIHLPIADPIRQIQRICQRMRFVVIAHPKGDWVDHGKQDHDREKGYSQSQRPEARAKTKIHLSHVEPRPLLNWQGTHGHFPFSYPWRRRQYHVSHGSDRNGVGSATRLGQSTRAIALMLAPSPIIRCSSRAVDGKGLLVFSSYREYPLGMK